MKIIFLIIIGLVLFFSFLGLRGLCEPDEGRYAEISREMINSGDWLTPRLNHIKHFHKPPLVYWFVSSSFLFLGVSEFTARLPVALLGILGLVITYLLSICLGYDKKNSFFSGLILASTLQYFAWIQVLTSDMVFSVFVLLAFYGFWKRNYLFYLGLALAFMVKGPAAVIIPALVIGIYAMFIKERIFNRGQFLKGIALFLLIVCPWFVYVCIKNPGLFNYFVFFQSLNRMFTEVHGRHGNIFYFIPVVILGGLPWIIFIPWAVKLKDKVNLFLFLWIIVPVVFFSFSGSKLPGYILPVYPALAIIIGRYLGEKKLYKIFYILFITASIINLAGTNIIAGFSEKLGNNLSIRKPAEIIKKYASPVDKVINFRCFLQGLPFYLEKRVILVEKEREIQFEEDIAEHKAYLVPDINDLFSNLKSDEMIWIFTKENDRQDLLKNCPFSLYKVWEESGYILLTNRVIANG